MSPRTIVQIVGWALICFGVVFVFGGFVGQGGGAAQEPGADTMRALIFERGVGQAALASVMLGVVVLLASLVMRRSDA
jgi:hypothetical protein